MVFHLYLLFLPFLTILVLFFIQKHKSGASLKPPGPKGLPLIGNLLQIDNSAPHYYLWQLSKRYGPLMSMRLGLFPTLVVSSAEMAKEVMKTHDLEFSGRPSFLGQQKLSYHGLDLGFATYGPYWREMKKLCVSHLFNSKQVQSFRHVREYEVQRMIKKIQRINSSSLDEVVIDLKELAMSLSSSIICRVAVGKNYEANSTANYKNGTSRFHVLLQEVQAMVGTFFFSDYLPIIGWVDRLRGMIGRLEKTFKEFDMFCQQIIDDHMDKLSGGENDSDIVDVLLRVMKENSFSINITSENIKAVLLDILSAGTDTPAATIVWAMTALMKNPRVMKIAKDEIRELFGEKDFINEEDIQRLPYLKAVVKETMRLYPPVPLLLPRETIQGCNINGYEIKPKTLVFVNALAIGRDPAAWEEPEAFIPERFLDSPIDFRGLHFELIPFGAGRRICPAVYMSAIIVELSLANLLHSFNWDLPSGTKREDIDTDVMPGITMHKKNALCLVAK
uniref:Cytochrome P450 oxidase CYP71AT147 n=1 Tax=Polygala tenuifolia TaxID=355332 RepID=A0A3G5ANY8_9FABA|nr:cytochrome P450 oxidase CYP71AT147 [Polygala tenuifolia]